MRFKKQAIQPFKVFLFLINEMTQWIRKLAAKSEDLSLIPGTHCVEEEKWFLQVLLNLFYDLWHTHISTPP